MIFIALRMYWPNYFENTDALVYVIDSAVNISIKKKLKFK